MMAPGGTGTSTETGIDSIRSGYLNTQDGTGGSIYYEIQVTYNDCFSRYEEPEKEKPKRVHFSVSLRRALPRLINFRIPDLIVRPFSRMLKRFNHPKKVRPLSDFVITF